MRHHLRVFRSDLPRHCALTDSSGFGTYPVSSSRRSSGSFVSVCSLFDRRTGDTATFVPRRSLIFFDGVYFARVTLEPRGGVGGGDADGLLLSLRGGLR